MKRLLAVTLVLVIILAAAGCAAAPAANKLGFASITSIGSSKDLADKDGVKSGQAQADTMMCAVTVDANGKVVDIKIDVVQAKVAFDEAGMITSDKAAEVKTKRDLGDAYGMKKASGIGREWYEQADAIQKWMIGKTAEQIKGMKLKAVEGGNVSDEADLATGATIHIDDFIKAAVKAIESAK